MFDEQERDHALEHRHFDHRAFAGLEPVGQPRCDREREMQADDLVGDDRRQEARRTGRIGVEAREPAHRLDDVVIGRLVSVRTVLTEARGEAVDESRD